MHASRALSACRYLHCGLWGLLLSDCGRKHMPNSHSPGCAQVGKAFIQQYYTVLHSRPKYLHRFYTNNSSLTIGEQDGPPSTTVTGQAVRSAPFPPFYSCMRAGLFVQCPPVPGRKPTNLRHHRRIFTICG